MCVRYTLFVREFLPRLRDDARQGLGDHVPRAVQVLRVQVIGRGEALRDARGLDNAHADEVLGRLDGVQVSAIEGYHALPNLGVVRAAVELQPDEVAGLPAPVADVLEVIADREERQPAMFGESQPS